MNTTTVTEENLGRAIMEISIPDGNLKGAKHVLEYYRYLTNTKQDIY